jgi:hypothetical protein
MLLQQLKALRDFILQYNTYFTEGYYDVTLDPVIGYVHDRMPVFPADNLGDYFYLRLPDNMTFSTAPQYNVTEDFNPAGPVMKTVLVASVRNGDPDILLNNLLTTIGRYEDAFIQLISASNQKAVIIVQELAKLKPDTVEEALKRADMSATLATITFNISNPFLEQELTCIKNPCIC